MIRMGLSNNSAVLISGQRLFLKTPLRGNRFGPFQATEGICVCRFYPFLSRVFISILVGDAITASTVFDLVFIFAGNIRQRAEFVLG